MMSFTRLGLLACAFTLAGCGGETDPETATPEAPPEPTIIEENGTLVSGDDVLESGEYYDTYEILAREGQWLRIELLSSDFDPYLIVRSPTGTQTDVDDSQEGNRSHTKSIVEATESGNWLIGVTTFEAGESGSYTFSYEVLDSKPADASEGQQVTPEASGDSTTAI